MTKFYHFNYKGKGHIFLKSNTSGPTHSTPNDSKKKSNENERSNFATALKENSTKVERVSNRYARIGEVGKQFVFAISECWLINKYFKNLLLFQF